MVFIGIGKRIKDFYVLLSSEYEIYLIVASQL